MLRRREQSLLAPLRWGLLSLNNPSSYFLSFNTIALTFHFSKFAGFHPRAPLQRKGDLWGHPTPRQGAAAPWNPAPRLGTASLRTLLSLSNWQVGVTSRSPLRDCVPKN